MNKENLVSLAISESELSDIRKALDVLQSRLLPHLIELTNDEKESMPKMGDKTVAFVTKATEHAEANTKLVPAYVDVAELRKDLNAIELLRPIFNGVNQIAKSLEDTMMIAGSEAYIAALAFYQSTKVAAKMNVTGAQEIYNDLQVRFPTKNRKKPS
jgi:hypothetical protein